MDTTLIAAVSKLMEIREDLNTCVQSSEPLSLVEAEDLLDDIDAMLAEPDMATIVMQIDALFFSDHMDFSEDEEDEEELTEEDIDVQELLALIE